MAEEARTYTIEALADAVGVPVRTIRFYIGEGLLPGPDARGRSAAYGQEHLLRLRLIRRLVDQHVPLSEVRERLAGLSLDDVHTILRDEDRRSERRRVADDAPSPKAYVAELLAQATAAEPLRPSLAPAPVPAAVPLADSALARRAMRPAEQQSPTSWRRWRLAEGVELHVRADVEQHARSLIRRLLDAAGVTSPTARNPQP
jgi:DNA-binding transcriptional MerR regulator